MLLGLSMNSLFNPSILSALKDAEWWSQFWSASSQGGNVVAKHDLLRAPRERPRRRRTAERG
jgi:hypothetical protein